MYRLTDFVTIERNVSGFDPDELISVCGRKNNAKRNFLFVNHYQGKHLAVDPNKAFALFDRLYDEASSVVEGKVLLVGFAETATAISSRIMHDSIKDHRMNIVYYIQTTREQVDTDNADFSFLEEHSHAAEQHLYLGENIPEFDSILFVDDELTTGNTILNFIKVFEAKGYHKKYYTASFLNWQAEKDKERFKKSGVTAISLISGSIIAGNKDFAGTKGLCKEMDDETEEETFILSGKNPRIGLSPAQFEDYISMITMPRKTDGKSLVIGTEEYMYIPMLAAQSLDADVLTTTRSPIAEFKGDTVNDSVRMRSAYDSNRTTYLYNVEKMFDTYDHFYLVGERFTKVFLKEMKALFGEKLIIKEYGTGLVETSYPEKDVTILLQDVRGKVPVLDTKEREILNQSGVHYSEMLPLEYVPTKEYMNLYLSTLDELSQTTANAVASLAAKVHRENLVIVSLARAGTPVGILLKRYLKQIYGLDAAHYSISIVRGKGFDIKAMEMITSKHPAKDILFLDGWVGKGAINSELIDAVNELKKLDWERYKDLSPELAVLSDPAGVTELCGTRQDFLIPSACLNATVSGLDSRTVKTKDMTDEELHGSVFYSENKDYDQSMNFIEKVCECFENADPDAFHPSKEELDMTYHGIDEVLAIGREFGISDIHKIKPGVGETTRVLLRRQPQMVLLREDADEKYIKHLVQLCKEKKVPIVYHNLRRYNCIGIIANMKSSDI